VPDLLPERPANVLALQRSGTAGKALTFVVFREQPEAAWVTLPGVFPVDLDPDRLAPAESVTGTIEIFLGLPQDQELLRIGSHPITSMLDVAAEHRLSVLEVQLPVPAPTGAYPNRHWARVQIALREFEIERILPFLESIRKCADDTHSVKPDTCRPDSLWITGIQTVSEGSLRIINPPSAAGRSITGLILASDMDVIAPGGSLSDQGCVSLKSVNLSLYLYESR
jgi:hypothetical protein